MLVIVGEEGQQATLAKSLLASSLLSQGTPIIPQDALDDPGLSAFVSSVVQFRHNHSALLQPHHFSSSRELVWHGATIGCHPAVHALPACMHSHSCIQRDCFAVQPGVMLGCLSLLHISHNRVTPARLLIMTIMLPGGSLWPSGPTMP